MSKASFSSSTISYTYQTRSSNNPSRNLGRLSNFYYQNVLQGMTIYWNLVFDKVWPDGFLFKLQRNGIEGQLLQLSQLFKSYLSNRKQRVVINGFESGWGLIEAGIPQGSVLGPLLFLIYINDLENVIISNVKFFAGDTSLFSIVTNPTLSAFELNSDLKVIENWAYQWKMLFNPDPNKQAIGMLFSRKRVDQNHPPLFFNNMIIAILYITFLQPLQFPELGKVLTLLNCMRNLALTDRSWYRRLLQFYKIVNDLAPSYLEDIIPPLRRSLYGHPRHVFHEIFSPSYIVFFRIVSNLGTILEVNLRRYHLSPNSKKLYWVSFVQLKSPYLVFTILPLSKKLFQLRVGLSQMRSHKKHNLVDTPSNLCICNLDFSIPRLFLVDTVPDIFSQNNILITNLNMKDLVNIYLYGDPSFKVSENRLILLATIKFIIDSNRFVKEDWQYFRLKFFLVVCFILFWRESSANWIQFFLPILIPPPPPHPTSTILTGINVAYLMVSICSSVCVCVL